MTGSRKQTGRKRKQHLRKDSATQAQLRLAAVAKWSDDAIIGKDLNGIITNWNNGAERIYGYSAYEVIGKPISLLLPSDRPDDVAQIMKRIRGGEVIRRFETVRQRKDGTRVEVSLTISPIMGAQGRIIGVSTIARDISERKYQEAVLRESEERFRLAMNNVASGLYTLDLQGLVTYVNPAAETMFGWTSAELLGKKIHDVIHYEHLDGTPFPASECPGMRVLQEGVELREHEDMFIRKDGTFFPVVFSASQLKNDNKTVGIVVGFRDDTHRREALQVLRESEERFRLVANTAPVMIWMSGVDKLCTYVNQGWLEFTGRSFQDELGNGWTGGVHPDDLTQCVESISRAFDRREPFRIQYRFRRHDGEYRWIFDQGVPKFDSEDSFAGYIGSCIDVTEHKLAEEALSAVRHMLIRAQEEERNRIGRELHDDISQQLALLSVEIQQTKEAPPGLAESLRNRMDQLEKRISETATSVHSLSHELHSSRLEYLGLASAMKGFCREFGDKHKVKVAFASEGMPARLPPDISVCLFRVMQEALHNALKYSGAKFFEVKLRGSPDIDLTIRDSGAGFEMELLGDTQGLGLVSMQERVRLVNGTISINSKPGSGTEISVHVPLSEDKHLVAHG